MKIVIAPDSFKGSLSSVDVSAALERGIRRIFSEAVVDRIPLADGGEGTVASLVDATGGEVVDVGVTGPLGERVPAFFGVLGDGETAVVEMAAASGLPLVPVHKRDPRRTATRGTGELILAALDRGCRRILVGVGGSATNDGGVGMAQALGISFKDPSGLEIGPGGAALADIDVIDTTGIDPRVRDAEFTVACDVDNPLCGPKGASAVYGPQKGATPEMVTQLDDALSHLADRMLACLGVDVACIPGAGAAGGLGAGLVGFLGATLRRGAEIVSEAVGLEHRVASADIVLTGEGAIDGQTAFGKAPSAVATLAKKCGTPVIAVAGTVSQDAFSLYEHGFDAIYSCTLRPMALEDAMKETARALEYTGELIARTLRVGRRLVP